MSTTAAMIKAHPNPTEDLKVNHLAEAIDACLACVQTCTSCADACLGEDSVSDLRDCIRTDLDCADICVTTATVLSRRTGSNIEVVKELLTACRKACIACAEDCESHADHHEHCKICAEACRRCEKACTDLLGVIG
ncbi:four-helix bundle copper-binding protein [Corynebacterium halotolerans]|uniref:Ferredoxin n=1 Tax=Corynebacterium halotolerans YIM 70093 = DSM 44683 TaxID=1121362 RepID=M1NIF5_9CORY|nr:four-helix bundle copper-binding protein [Corynebacterium halotolerans]AGF71198.1 hypothetical protein A605_00910 [Corynebacterium halotolerans YIM 70093 = DSM 44683]